MEEKKWAKLEVGKIYKAENSPNEYLIIRKQARADGSIVYYSYPHFNHCGHVVHDSGWLEDGIPLNFGMECLFSCSA